jgi:hypothetical protein
MTPGFSAFELEEGALYEVIAPFEDFDGAVHPAGDRWRYRSRNYFPYDAGLTLYIEREGKPATLRLQDYPEAQGPVIDAFHQYVRCVP